VREAVIAAEAESAEAIQAGAIQAGAIQAQAGAIQAGAIQAGAIQAGAIQAGAIQAGAIQAGARAGARAEAKGASEYKRFRDKIGVYAGWCLTIVPRFEKDKLHMVEKANPGNSYEVQAARREGLAFTKWMVCEQVEIYKEAGASYGYKLMVSKTRMYEAQ
jgi:hypothetical protein